MLLRTCLIKGKSVQFDFYGAEDKIFVCSIDIFVMFCGHIFSDNLKLGLAKYVTTFDFEV